MRAFADLAALADETDPGFDAEAASPALTAATAALAAPTADGPAPLEQNTAPIADAIAACERAAVRHTEQLQADGHRRIAEVEARRTALAERTRAHQRHTDDTAKASALHTRAVARTTTQVSTLPPASKRCCRTTRSTSSPMRQPLPPPLSPPGMQKPKSCSTRGKRQGRRKPRYLANSVPSTRTLRVRLEHPLNQLRGRLDVWAQAVTEALTHLDASTSTRRRRPRPSQRSPKSARTPPELSTTTSTLGDKLTRRAIAAADHAATAENSLSECAAALTDVDGFDTHADLTTPDSAPPLVAAVGQATKEAKDQRQKQQEAQDLTQASR
ncbi:hypothetical protein ACE6JH_00015 [Streptomyces nigra]